MSESQTPAGDAHPPRPNIVFVFSDQHRHDCTGYAGHPLVQTPNLDRLAAEGLIYTHAGCPIPVCSPARQSLMSGRWPVHHGGIALYNLSESTAAPAPDETWFPMRLREAGYHLGYVGKWHVSPDHGPAAAGFHEVFDSDEKNRKKTSVGETKLPPRHNLPPAPPVATDAPYAETRAGRFTEQALTFLRGRKSAEATAEPFFLMVNYEEPHPPYHAPREFFDRYDPGKIEPWANFADDLEGKPRQQRQMRRVWNLDGKPWRGYWDRQVAGYLANVSRIDHMVGRLLDELDALGLAENTLFVYSTDHGDMTGAHGLYDKHCNLYDDIVRVPLLMRWPRAIAAGRTYDGFVCNGLDLAATFNELAEGATLAEYDGRSLCDVIHDGETERPDYRNELLCTYHGGQFGMYSQRMLRTKAWKYIWNPTDLDELYDLQNDPGELVNLATDPAHAGRLAQMRKRLFERYSELADPLFKAHWVPRMLLDGAKL